MGKSCFVIPYTLREYECEMEPEKESTSKKVRAKKDIFIGDN